PQKPYGIRVRARDDWPQRQRAEMAALAKSVQVGRSRSEKRARSERSEQITALLYQGLPIQSFLWGDYTAAPGTAYRCRSVRTYGKPGVLTSGRKEEPKLEIETEKEWEEGAGHGVWFNRGAIASQKFAEEFGNAPPKNIDDPTDAEVVWLSRGLLE